MGIKKIEFDIVQPFDVTQNNTIGPTKDLNTRNNSDLPYPAARSNGTPDFDTINVDNDAATIYLDPDNGSDGNTGTDLSSDAIQTLPRAWVILSAARPKRAPRPTPPSPVWCPASRRSWTIPSMRRYVPSA